VNVFTSTVIVVLPGRHGTLDGIRLATRFAKSLIRVGPSDAFEEEAPNGTQIASSLRDVYAFVLKRVTLR
jgi:hypothetical protein